MKSLITTIIIFVFACLSCTYLDMITPELCTYSIIMSIFLGMFLYFTFYNNTKSIEGIVRQNYRVKVKELYYEYKFDDDFNDSNFEIGSKVKGYIQDNIFYIEETVD